MRTNSYGFSTMQTERPHRAPPKKTSKNAPPKQDITLLLYSSTMTVVPL